MKNWRFYLITVSSVLFIGIIKLLLIDLTQVRSPLLLFFVAITISAWVGGLFHGLLATVLSFLFSVIFIYNGGEDWSAWYTRSGLYFIDGIVISLICHKLRSSRDKLGQINKEFRLTEESLLRSQRQISQIFESNMIGIVFSHFDGTVTKANDYFLKMLQVTRADYSRKGLKLEQLKYPDVTSRPPFEKEFIRSDGQRVSALVGAAKVDEESVVSFVLDISERKSFEIELENAKESLEEHVDLRTRQLTKANQSLQESQAFLDSVIENIPNMIFVKDAKDLKFIRFNKAGSELVGMEPEELLGKSDQDFFPKEQAEFFIQKDREVLASKAKLDIPVETLPSPKGIRYLHTIKIPILDKDENPQYLLGISEDITEKLQTENQRLQLLQAQAARVEAEKSASRFEFLANATSKLNESLDLNQSLSSFASEIVKHMASWCIISLYDESESSVQRVITSSSQTDLSASTFLKSEKIKASAPLNSVLKEGRRLLYQQVDLKLLEQMAFCDETIEKVLNQSKASLIVVPLAYQSNIHGALTLISREQDSVYGNLELAIAEDLAKRASLAIENSRYFLKANEANRAKTAFLANMSHEIRTPLGAMLGFAEITLDDPELSDESASHILTILRNGHQLLQLVDEVLDISKVESEKIEIEKIDFFPVKLIEDIMALLRVKSQAKGLELGFKMQESLPRVINTDPFRLRQILLNVVGNAIKFTESGSVNLSLKFNRSKDRPGRGQLEFLVEDTGIGISPDQEKSLFEPFTQADSSMSRKFGGTGLGLFLSRKLARLMGGDVKLKKCTPHGCEFEVLIEVGFSEVSSELDEMGSEVPSSVRPPLNAPEKPQNQKGRVLVVEDSPENRIIARSFLKKMGIPSDFAVNGAEGVRKAESSNYDVVLMDIQMPEMDGFEAIHRLRHDGYTGRVVALTAHAMKGDRERCLEHGFDDYLCKPINRSALSACISRYLPQTEENPARHH